MYGSPYSTSVVGFNLWPAVWSGVTGPLTQNPLAMIETPEVQKLGVGPWLTFRRWAWPVGYLPHEVVGVPPWQWARGPTQAWGISSDTEQLDAYDRVRNPAAASETLQAFDVQRCVTVTEDQIVPTGVAFELVRFDAVPGAAVGVVERLPSIFESVEAVDDQGVAIFSFGELNGENPCLSELVHPTPGIGSLTWRFSVTLTQRPFLLAGGQLPTPYLGPLAPEQIQGGELLPSWADARNGTAVRWPDRRQLITPPRVMVRYWVTLFGPQNAFRLRVGGRLGGYTQTGGRRGSAVAAATTRIV